MSQLFSNNVNSFNTLNLANNRASVNDQSQILGWLSTLHPKSRHEEIQAQRAEGVGEWLLQTEEFKLWHDGVEGDESGKAVLFCYGGQGAGKTFIRHKAQSQGMEDRGQVLMSSIVSSLVIDTLCDRARGRDIAVVCFYFDSTAQKERSPTIVLGALLRQVVAGLEEIPREIVQAYRDQKNCIGGRGPQHSDIVKMLQNTSSKRRTFICIDALNDCTRGHRGKLLDSLNQILRKAPGTRVFLTGKPDIRPEIGRLLAGRVTSLSMCPGGDDDIRYLRSGLVEDISSDTMDRLKAKISKKIPESISQMYVKQRHQGGYLELSTDRHLPRSPLVSPDFDAIPRKRQKLGSMNDGLGLESTCDSTLGGMKGRGGEKAKPGAVTSMRISYSGRPLKAELCRALVVEIGLPDLNTSGVPPIGISLSYRQLPFMADETTSAARSAYSSHQEHPQPYTDLSDAARSTMEETWLGYSNFQQVKAFATSPLPRSPRTPPSRKPLSVPDNPRKKRTLRLRETACSKAV